MLLALAFSLHGLLFAGLIAVCAFDDGHLAHDWTDCVIPLGLVLLPLVVAVLGGTRRDHRLLIAAAVSAGIFGLLSITGPGLFLLVPAILYGMCIPARTHEGSKDLPGPPALQR